MQVSCVTTEPPRSVIYNVLEDLNYGILRVLEENLQKEKRKNTRRLSEELGASKDTAHRQTKTLGK